MKLDLHKYRTWINELMQATNDLGGSDLIISANVPPHAKVRSEVIALSDVPVTADTIKNVAHSLLSLSQYEKLTALRSLDIGLEFEAVGLVRCNFFNQRNSLAFVGRILPGTPPVMSALGLPPVCQSLFDRRNGLILVAGPTGSGKSSTMAAAINYLNSTKRHHILSIEDPIEYIHPHNKCVIEQIELGRDTNSFASALKASLRQAPDVIAIGELRDKETIETALTLAETGHLVLATVHARDSIQALSRLAIVFPAEQQEQIFFILSQVLIGVIAQQLVPNVSKKTVALAAEVLIVNTAIQNLIQNHQVDQIYSVLQSQGDFGMKTMNDSLRELVQENIIHKSEALSRSTRPKELSRNLDRL
jgi:twitching motility protein PilT